MAQGNSTATSDSAARTLSEVRVRSYTVYHNEAWYGMAVLAVFLLAVCSLLAGLTLAVCGLNITWLQLRTVTGTSKQRQQALVVARMKSRSTWMLCSLIICSVACGESLPFVIQSLWSGPQQWVPIVISTLSIALFAEILPQYLVPRQAIAWGYYCWPIIWGSMWLTGIISYPLARFLDHMAGSRDEPGIFTNEELAMLLKYHERSENHGGMLGQDAARIMLGALDLDSRRIGTSILKAPGKCSNGNEKDVEKADYVVIQGMVVKWSMVKTVNIDEPVDKAFIQKVSAWAYSRIPVVGEDQEPGDSSTDHSDCDSKKIFGFLHIKNLVGLEIEPKENSRNGMFVRDLPLYPLPIVRDDMPAYALLNMFQLGMSRMVVVIPTLKTPSSRTVSHNLHDLPQFMTQIWTGTERKGANIAPRLKHIGRQVDLAKGFLEAAHSSFDSPECQKQTIIGIESPMPAGIVTFEDIIDTILQKTSRDERDFFDRDNAIPKTKVNRAGDCPTLSTGDNAKGRNAAVPAYAHNRHPFLMRSRQENALRKRNPSKKEKARGAMDGVDERSVDGADDNTAKRYKMRNKYAESSYTQNTAGGFHGADKSGSDFQNDILLNVAELVELGIAPSSTPIRADPQLKAATLPSRKGQLAILPGGLAPVWRHASSSPRLPKLRRVTPFSRQNYSSYERMADEERDRHHLTLPIASMFTMAPPLINTVAELKPNPSDIEVNKAFECSNSLEDTGEILRDEDGGDTISLNSWPYGNLDAIDDLNLRSYDFFVEQSTLAKIESSDENLAVIPHDDRQSNVHEISPKPHSGVPPKMLDKANGKENRIPKYGSSSLSRMIRVVGDGNNLKQRRHCDTPLREDSFHDDRALLPSQRRLKNGSESMNIGGARSSSFWF